MRDMGKMLKRMVSRESEDMSRGGSRRILKSVGHEMKGNPPRILAKTRRKAGPAAAEKQRKAILLDKARRRGARISKR